MSTSDIAPHQDLAAAPVDALEPHRGDLAAAQPEPHQQYQDRVIAASDRSPSITTRQQAGTTPISRRCSSGSRKLDEDTHVT